MDFGVGYFPTHDATSPGAVARMAEEWGQSALYFAEHTHIPASRETPFPGDGPLPVKYSRTYDLFVALATAAAATSRIRIGSGVCLLIQRDPIITAKAVASLDHLSGGRFDFGVGAGWNREEMRNHGTDPRVRMAILRERVEAMREIWAHDEASYHGQYVSFDRIWCDPRPAQWPHPPILVGGDGPSVLDRVLAFGDGWMPNPHEGMIDRIHELRQRAERPVDVRVLGVAPDPFELERLEAAGVSRVMFWLPSAGRAVVEAHLEAWQAAIASLRGEG